MKKAFRFFVWVLILVIIGVSIFVATFDLNKYKPQIESFVSQELEMDFKINGSAKFAVIDYIPVIALQDIVLSTAGEGPVFKTKLLGITLPPQKLAGIKNTPQVMLVTDRFYMDDRLLGRYHAKVYIKEQGVSIPNITGQLGTARIYGAVNYLDNTLTADIKIKDLPYKELVAEIEGGQLRIDAVLEAKGETGDQLMRSLDGTFQLVGDTGTAEGKSIDLWGADLLTSILFARGDKTKINCTIADFKIENGIATSRATILDTERVAVFGRGKINLIDETVNMKFDPKPKTRALLDLGTTLHVEGPLGNVSVSTDSKELVQKLGGVLLGTVNPAAALVPYVLQDTSEDNPCVKYFEQQQEKE